MLRKQKPQQIKPQPKKHLKMLLAVSLASILTGCSTLTIPNVEICADEAQFGAFCKDTRDANHRSIDKATWDLLRAGKLDNQGPWFCMTAPSLDKYQKFVEGACNNDKNCIDEVTTKIQTYNAKFRQDRAADMKRKASKNPKLMSEPGTEDIPL